MINRLYVPILVMTLFLISIGSSTVLSSNSLEGFDIVLDVDETIAFGRKHATISIEAHNLLNKTVYLSVLGNPVIRVVLDNDTVLEEEIHVVNREYVVKPLSRITLANITLVVPVDATIVVDRGVYRAIVDARVYILGSSGHGGEYRLLTRRGVELVQAPSPTHNTNIRETSIDTSINNTNVFNNTAMQEPTLGGHILVPTDLLYAIAIATVSLVVAHVVVRRLLR